MYSEVFSLRQALAKMKWQKKSKLIQYGITLSILVLRVRVLDFHSSVLIALVHATLYQEMLEIC